MPIILTSNGGQPAPFVDAPEKSYSDQANNVNPIDDNTSVQSAEQNESNSNINIK